MSKTKYALEVSTEIIRKIEKSKLGDINFSSCGGIVYVHSHFPFYRAYELAEQLCSNAKDKAKKEENKVNGRAQSYLDFELLQAGVVSTITHTIKERALEDIIIYKDGVIQSAQPIMIKRESALTKVSIDFCAHNTCYYACFGYFFV